MSAPATPALPPLAAHLAEGSAQTCRCWAVRRRDGISFGFTDHDRMLSFDGISFRPESGLTARALQQTTGLSVDNSEAMGALRSDAITEGDIAAGRFDGAEVTAFVVRWDDVSQRRVLFRGTIGELRRAGGAFHAELRGLTEALGHSGGRVFHRLCPAVLGDRACGLDLTSPLYSAETTLSAASEDGLSLPLLDTHPEGWFARGRVELLSGAAKGLTGLIKSDRNGADRSLTLWAPLGVMPAPGDRLRLIAGCDKTAETCRAKFGNMVNFRGFPTIPGEDWLVSVPRRDGINDGGPLT